MSKPEISDATALVIRPEMARALADARRSRILMELSVRPLSPSQFAELVGDELSIVSRCFRQLADWEFIEIAKTMTGGARRGAIEHVYRRVQRALFDTSVWEDLPLKYRDECSGSTLDSYIARISEAIAARTFDDEGDRHLSWDAVALDRIAWTELGSRLDEILHWFPSLVIESARRMAETGEEPIPTTLGLASFRSPAEIMVDRPRLEAEPIDSPLATPLVVSPGVAKAVASKWRSRILMEMRVRLLSPTLFVEKFGGSKRHIARCFEELARWGFIEHVETRVGGRRRGGKEKFFRLKLRAHFDTRTWERLPRFLKDECSASFLHSYFARVNEAITAGTFDAELDRHLSWDGGGLDRQAWNQLITALDKALEWIPGLEEEAAKRMGESGEAPIPTTFHLAAFRSPKSSETPLRKKSASGCESW